MATAKKTITPAAAPKAVPAKKAAKAAAPAKKVVKAAAAPAPKVVKVAAAPAKKAVKAAAPTKKAAKAAAPAKAAVALKPIKTAFNKTGLISHLAEMAAAEIKTVKAVFASLEATIMASINKKGLGSFTLPGLLKVNVVNVPAKKKRVGIDPFTKVERTFAAKPATVKIKTRALKKLKDAAA